MTAVGPMIEVYRCTGMGRPLSGTSRGVSAELVAEWAELRSSGLTYREIGQRYGYSHERVRQVIAHLNLPDPAESRRRQRADEIASWLHANGPAPLSRLAEELGVTDRSVVHLAKMVPGVIPLHLAILSSRPTVNHYRDDQLIEALREVSGRLPQNRRTRGMSHQRYEEHRRADQPSAAVVINRLGTWETACETAGIESGGWMRPKESYGTRWSETDLLAAVAEYAQHAAAAGAKPTYSGYDVFQRSREHLPSGTTVRNRMRSLGVGTWPEIMDRALGRVRAA